MRLIDADKLHYKRVIVVAPHNDYYDEKSTVVVFAKDIDKAKTVDAVPVVRCSECKHCDIKNTNEVYAICTMHGVIFRPFGIDTRSNYCSFGVRKMDSENQCDGLR